MYVHRALAYQAIHPCEVGKLALVISRGDNAMERGGGVVGSSLYR